MPCIPQKSMWEAARTIQLAHILETNEKPIKTERFPKKSSLEGNEGNIGEKWEIWQVRKITTGKGQVEYYFVVFPTGKNYFRGIGDTLHSSKTKVSSCQNHPTRPETGKKMKNLSKPNASQKKVLWREMKEIWEKEGKTWKARKTTIAKS